jgi:uncharacterized protein HemY
VASFREAMADPDLEAQALEHLGMLALSDREFARAEEYFQELVKLAPDYERREEIDRALALIESIREKQQ